MTDLVERLRRVAADYEVGWHTEIIEAADEIERLQATIARIREAAGSTEMTDYDPGPGCVVRPKAPIEAAHESESLTDIVENLRRRHNDVEAIEAANEINWLRLEIERLRERCESLTRSVDRDVALLNDEITDNGKLRDEIERLRALLVDQFDEVAKRAKLQARAELAEARVADLGRGVQNAEIERLQAALDDEMQAHCICVERRDEAILEADRLRTENWQLKQACGYPIPADKETPQNPFKCGPCEAKNNEIERLRAQRDEWRARYRALRDGDDRT